MDADNLPEFRDRSTDGELRREVRADGKIVSTLRIATSMSGASFESNQRIARDAADAMEAAELLLSSPVGWRLLSDCTIASAAIRRLGAGADVRIRRTRRPGEHPCIEVWTGPARSPELVARVASGSRDAYQAATLDHAGALLRSVATRGLLGEAAAIARMLDLRWRAETDARRRSRQAAEDARARSRALAESGYIGDIR